MSNPEKIEIAGLKTIHKLCKFGADHNMEGCTFTEIVERMFDELVKAQAVPKYHQQNIRDALVIACDIQEDERRFEDSLNYVHKGMIEAQELAND